MHTACMGEQSCYIISVLLVISRLYYTKECMTYSHSTVQPMAQEIDMGVAKLSQL